MYSKIQAPVIQLEQNATIRSLAILRTVNNLECKSLSHSEKYFSTSYTAGPLIIESFQAKKRVSTGALGALDDPLMVQTKI